jgi:hypothetical protein
MTVATRAIAANTNGNMNTSFLTVIRLESNRKAPNKRLTIDSRLKPTDRIAISLTMIRTPIEVELAYVS